MSGGEHPQGSQDTEEPGYATTVSECFRPLLYHVATRFSEPLQVSGKHRPI